MASTSRLLFAWLAGAALLCWAAFNWYATVRRLVSCYLPLPFWDYWRVIENYAQYKGLNPAFLWQQHNAHRIIFPEIIFALDALFCHGCAVLSLIVSFLCYFSLWAVIAWAVLADRTISRFACAAAVLLSGIVIGWEGSVDALAQPFLLQWPLTQLAAILSLAFLTLAKTRKAANLYLSSAIIAAVIATYSSGNGMMLWPVLIGAAFVISLPKRQIVALAASGAVAVGLYFVGFHFSEKLDIANFFLHPLYSLEFLGAYLAMPFGAIKSRTFCVFVGLPSFAIVLGLLVCAARYGMLRTRTAVILFGSYAFVVLTALITAAGRMNPSDPTFANAKAVRYVTVPLVSWAIFISLCLWSASRRRWKVFSPSTLTLLFALLIAVDCFKLRWSIHVSNQEFADVQQAMLSVEDGLDAPSLIRKFFPDPTLVNRRLPEMKQNRLSIYYRPLSSWLGQPVSRFGSVANAGGHGSIAKTCQVSSGVQVFGWADDGRKAPRYRWVVLANEAGQIAGFGERFPAGVPADVIPLNIPHALSWVGFINLQIPGSAYRAYVVDPSNRRLIPLRGSFTASQFRGESCLSDMA